MCLAIPMRITEINGGTARCEARGVRRDVSLLLLHEAPPRIGDFVSVELGYATRVVSETEALASWALFDEILAADP